MPREFRFPNHAQRVGAEKADSLPALTSPSKKPRDTGRHAHGLLGSRGSLRRSLAPGVLFNAQSEDIEAAGWRRSLCLWINHTRLDWPPALPSARLLSRLLMGVRLLVLVTHSRQSRILPIFPPLETKEGIGRDGVLALELWSVVLDR